MNRVLECNMPKKGYVRSESHRAALSISLQGNTCSVKHGSSPRGARTPEYTAWTNMRARCLRSNHPKFKDYGGRGIRICERWGEFANFLADMGARPSETDSLDRIDNDGDYTPDNCRWTTRSVQRRNSRSRSLTDDEISYILCSSKTGKVLSIELGVSDFAVYSVRRKARS